MAENYWLGRKVLITGASGFVGQHLAGRLAGYKANVAVTELDRSTRFLSHNRFVCNLIDYDAVNRVISRFQPEFVFHLAAQPIVDIALVAPFDTMETNIRGTYNLLEVCRTFDCVKSFVYMSTDKVYGETNYIEGKYSEGTREPSCLDGVNHPYNASKLCADVLAQSFASFTDLPISIIRSGNIYGEGDLHWERLIPYVCKQLITRNIVEFRSNGFLVRDYIYIDDVVDALLLMSQAKISEAPPFPRIYNLGSYIPYSVAEIFYKLVKISGIPAIPEYTNSAQFELRFQHMNFDKIKNELGWEPRTMLDEGLKKTYAWYKDYLK